MNVEAIRKNSTLLRRILSGIICLLLIVSLLTEIRAWSFYHIPKELRESTMLKIADDFADGVNPYALSTLEAERPAVFSHYGFLCPLFTAMLIKITGMQASLAGTVLTLLWKGLSLLMMWKIVCRRTDNKLIGIWSVLLFSACFWRYVPSGGVFPDALGICLTMAGYWLLADAEKTRKYHPVLLALLMVLLFYTKLYFVAFGIGVFLYLFLRDKKSCLYYVIAGLTAGMASIIAVNLIMPLFFTESIFYLRSEVELKFWYSCKQMLALGKYYLLPILLLIIWLAGAFRELIINKKTEQNAILALSKEHKFISHEFLQILVMILVVLYFGQNGGTWITYHLQLLLPPAIIVCAQVFHNIRWEKWKPGGAILLGSAFLLLSSVQVLPLTIDTSLDDEQVRTWNLVYGWLEEARQEENGGLLLAPPLSYWCVDHDVYTNDYGHANYVMESCVQDWRASGLYQAVFPHAEELWEQHENYRKLILDKIRNGEYSFIGIGYGDFGLDEGSFGDGYILMDTRKVYAGNHRWEMFFYKKT